MLCKIRYHVLCFFVILGGTSILTSSAFSQPNVYNNYHSYGNIPHLQIERSMVYVPGNDWLYSHHASIIRFKNKFVAIWSNGHKDEDKPGQQVAVSTSTDGLHWSQPGILAQPSLYKPDTLNVLTAAGFNQFKDTLVAYYGEYSPYRTNQHLWAKTSVDGVNWSEPADMHVAVNPNHGPQKTSTGRLIISGNFTFPYTDDYRGLSGWKMTSFYPDSLYTEDNPETFYAPAEKLGLPPLCEASFYETNNKVIHALLRVTGDGWQGKLWLTESKDNGAHWSMPVESGFTDNDSKFHFGKLPNGNFYYVGIPDTLHHYDRNPLVLATSKDGKFFNRQYIIADEPYIMKKDGLWKGGEYGYPATIVSDGYMYVIISRKKEAIEVIRFKLSQLQK